MTLIEQRLSELREEYKTATPDRRKEIEITANQIKKSANYYPVKVEEVKSDFSKTVMDNLK